MADLAAIVACPIILFGPGEFDEEGVAVDVGLVHLADGQGGLGGVGVRLGEYNCD